MKKKISDIIAETLVAAKVERAYGLTGNGIDELLGSLASTPIKVVQVTHEEAGGFAAGADAQFSGNITVCLGSTGPGVVHCLNGLFDAHRNESPVLLIATQVSTSKMGLKNGMEVDVKSLYKQCSHYCETVLNAEQLPLILGQALQTITYKKGVAVVVVPQDMMTESIEFDVPRYIPKGGKAIIKPSAFELTVIADKINNAEKVVIFGGYGCIGAHDDIIALAKKIKAPIGWAYRGKQIFDYDNPYPIGMNGLLGDKSCMQAVHDCDLLLLLGTDFAFTNFYPEGAEIVQIDLNGTNLGRRHWITMGAIGDIKATIPELLPLVKEKSNDSFAQKATKAYEEVRKHMDKIAKQKPDDGHNIYPEFLANTINKVAAPDAAIVADVGTPWAYMAKYIMSLGTRKLYHSCLHGTMANALSSAIGLQMAFKDKQVISMCGDGGFTMLMGDILTIAREQLPIKTIIFNNGRLDFVALEMKSSGIIDYGTDLKVANFAQLAEDVGIKGFRAEKPGDLEAALKEMLDHPGPALLDVVVNPNSLLMPPSITVDMMQNFTKYMVEAFFSGERKTLKEMLEVNIPRQL
ncbi:MAG: thiamine pyrophosphate-dependent enzyme [Marinifilaceae bacterium]